MKKILIIVGILSTTSCGVFKVTAEQELIEYELDKLYLEYAHKRDSLTIEYLHDRHYEKNCKNCK